MTRGLGAGAAMAALLSALGGTAHGDVALQIGTVTEAPGQRVVVPIVLRTDGESVIAFQNDLWFEPQTLPVPRPDGERPNCAQDPALLPGLLGSRFSFLMPPFCEPGVDCATIRATASLSAGPFPAEAVVYTCEIQVASDAAVGSYAVRCTDFATSDAAGESVGGTCADGAIVVSGQPVPTATAPPTGGQTGQPTPPPVATPVLEVGAASGEPGDRVAVDVRLRTGGAAIAGVQADIAFSPAARTASGADGRPDCAYGTDPNVAGFSGIEFHPPGCADDCTAIRALIVTAELGALPDGALLMSCTVEIAADAPAGVYPLGVSNVLGSTPFGESVELAATDGSITVSSAAGEQQQPVTGTDAGMTAGGGCAIAEPGATTASWWLLAGGLAIGLLRRRRHRRGAAGARGPGSRR